MLAVHRRWGARTRRAGNCVGSEAYRRVPW